MRKIRECGMCGKEQYAAVCLECRSEFVTEETKDLPTAKQKFNVICPECKVLRKVSYTNFMSAFLRESVNKRLTCLKCSQELMRIACKEGKYPQMGKKKDSDCKLISVDGKIACKIEPSATGRCDRFLNDLCSEENYDHCIRLAIKEGWNGFKRVEI